MSSCPLLSTIFSLEDNLLHVFHALLHTVFVSNKKANFSRVHELFTYAHQQLTRRAGLERELAGLPELVPLDPVTIRQSLGPGIRAGWYASKGMAGRKDNCKMEEHPNKTLVEDVEKFDGYHNTVMQKMQEIDGKNLEEFAEKMCGNYHSAGHLNVCKLCADSNDADSSLMCTDATSAR